MKRQKEAERTDEQIMLLVQKGQTEEFNELVRRHYKSIYNFVYRILTDPEDAFDVTQTTFMKAFEASARYKPIAGKFKGWIGTIAYNQAINVIRGRKRESKVICCPIENEDIDGASYASFIERQPSNYQLQDEGLLSKERLEEIQNAIDGMPEKYRNPLLMRNIEGRKYSEIAEKLGCPEGTVKSTLHRARKLLKNTMVEAAGA